MKIKDKNNYETKVTTIFGDCGKNYEDNLKRFGRKLNKKGGYIDSIVTIRAIVIYKEKVGSNVKNKNK